MQALGDDDKANIHQTIDDEVLKRAGNHVPLDRDAAAADGSGLSVQGDLTLLGTTRPLAFDVDVGDGGTLTAVAVVKQTDWGMKPYSALFGALKVVDEVEVAIDVHLPDPQSRVDRLRVEPALDAGRQRAGAVRVERDVLDGLDLRRVAAVAADPRAVRPGQGLRGASSAMPASSRPLSRILAVALAIAAGAPSDGLVL